MSHNRTRNVRVIHDARDRTRRDLEPLTAPRAATPSELRGAQPAKPEPERAPSTPSEAERVARERHAARQASAWRTDDAKLLQVAEDYERLLQSRWDGWRSLERHHRVAMISRIVAIDGERGVTVDTFVHRDDVFVTEMFKGALQRLANRKDRR